MTILEALIKKVDGGESYFDRYATEDLKKQVMEYITISTSDAQWGNKTHYYDKVGPDKLAGNNPWIQNCKGELTLEGEYVMLVCARNSYKNENEGENYGFAAARGLYKPDDVPPELVTPMVGTDGTVIVNAVITSYSNGKKTIEGTLRELGTKPMGYTFSGYIQLTFSKSIYWYDGNNLKQIVAPKDGETDTDVDAGQISILKVTGAPDVFTKVTANASNSTFTFYFEGISSGQGFTMTNIFNSSGSDAGKSKKTLIVKFDRQYRHILEGYTVEGGPDFYEVMPYFNITWK